jgi:hypothetical protein
MSSAFLLWQHAGKRLCVVATSAAALILPSLALAADFGGEEAPPEQAFVAAVPPPVLFARPYNYVYEEHGVYYAPPYPLPYFGLFPEWGPQVAFTPQPYWQGSSIPMRPAAHRRR